MRRRVSKALLAPAILGLILGSPFPSHGADMKVAVLLGKGVSTHLAVLEGMRSIQGLEVEDFPMEGESADKQIQDIRSAGSKLVVAVGTRAAVIAKKNLPDIPLLFCLVLNPEKLELLGPTTAGIAVEIPARILTDIFLKIAPKTKRIGTIYNPATGAAAIKDAQGAFQARGITLLAEKAGSIGEISGALSSLRGKIDAFLMTSDPVVANAEAFSAILLYTFSEKLPLIAPALPLVDKGALVAIGPNFTRMGHQAGDLAKKILGGQSPGSIGLAWPDMPEYAINIKTAELIGLSIPEAVIAQAAKVVR